ncbi:hypothetical protein ABTX62_09115 [Streptomyces sp. NPDC096046]|uniref:hypothetical protein n=1 Tax=Streptomyces sp. NPDC096046 TaxID=3155542 RepID=UPI0033343303
MVIAVVVAAASAHENAVGVVLLDKVATDTGTVQKALVDQGFKNAVVRWSAPRAGSSQRPSSNSMRFGSGSVAVHAWSTRQLTWVQPGERGYPGRLRRRDGITARTEAVIRPNIHRIAG